MKYKIKAEPGKPIATVCVGDIIELEPVEDEPQKKTDVSLESKVCAFLIDIGYSPLPKEETKMLTEIAREHFQKHPEEIFDIECLKGKEFVEKYGIVSLDSVLECLDHAERNYDGYEDSLC